MTHGGSSPSLPATPTRAPQVLLTYADLPSRHGVVVDRTPDAVTITVPPRPRRWRVPAIVLMIVAGLGGAAYAANLGANGRWRDAMEGLVHLWAVAIALAVSLSKEAMSRRANLPDAEFRVTRDELEVCARGAGHAGLRRSCRRSDVIAVKGDLYGMGLTIRIRDRQMIEMLHHYPKGVRIWLARTIAEELALPPAAGGTREVGLLQLRT